VAPDPAELRRRALDLLARREHARAELAAKLRLRGFDPAAVDGLLDSLAEEGLQSDARYAGLRACQRAERGFGPVRIRLELRERGVEEAEAQAAIEAAGIDWPALARTERERRFGSRPPAGPRERARQARFLEYRGFPPELVRRILDTP
jgi:regulatory protein